jgi:uncharacterized protein YnzC (UPF0291/DUF896 family)
MLINIKINELSVQLKSGKITNGKKAEQRNS